MRTVLKGWACWRLDAVGVAICVTATLAAYLGGMKPLRHGYERLVAQQEQLRSQQEHAAKLENALTALRDQLQSVRTALDNSTLRLKPLSNLNLHVAEVSALAAQNGLQIDDVQTGGVRTGTHYEVVPLYLTCSGTYPTCTRFLNNLRHALSDTSVASLKLAAPAGDLSGSGTFRIDLQWHAALSRSAGTE